MIKKFFINSLHKYASKWLVLFIDLMLVFLSFFFAYFIRFNVSLDFNLLNPIKQIPHVLFLAAVSFLIVGSYKGIVRHTGLKDAFNIFLATSFLGVLIFSAATFAVIFNLDDFFQIPRSIIIIHYLVTTFVLILSRFIFKAFYEAISIELESIHNLLIYGAGNSGLITLNALNRDPKTKYEVVGFIDDNINKVGKKIDRVRIYDNESITSLFIKDNAIDEVVISMQNISTNKLLTITDKFIDLDVKVKIVPPLSKWIDGDLEVNQIKHVNIDDLLDRDPINIDNPVVQREVNNKAVLVSGAAGSIGSEISRQLSLYHCKLIILIDQAESSLYNLEQF